MKNYQILFASDFSYYTHYSPLTTHLSLPLCTQQNLYHYLLINIIVFSKTQVNIFRHFPPYRFVLIRWFYTFKHIYYIWFSIRSLCRGMFGLSSTRNRKKLEAELWRHHRLKSDGFMRLSSLKPDKSGCLTVRAAPCLRRRRGWQAHTDRNRHTAVFKRQSLMRNG